MLGIGEVHQFPWNGVRCWFTPFQDARNHQREPSAKQPLDPADRPHVEFAHHVVIAVLMEFDLRAEFVDAAHTLPVHVVHLAADEMVKM